MLRYIFICLFSVLFWSSPVLAEDEIHEESSCECQKENAEIESETQVVNENTGFSNYKYVPYLLASPTYLMSAYKFCETKKARTTLLTAAVALGLVVVCTCNGSVKLRPCPRQINYLINYLVSHAPYILASFSGMALVYMGIREQNRILSSD